MHKSTLLSLFSILLIAACEGEQKPQPSALSEAWLGRWAGPEGTYLDISQENDRYVIAIQSLDALEMFEGTAADGHIEFERAGKVESIRAGSGKDTGMKWLLDKENCLVIRTGEGFCR